MDQKISIILNDKNIEVASGSTILEVAQSQGIEIPTFCYNQRLKPFTSCFICVVEVENAKGLVPACATMVSPGMVIKTDSEKVIQARKTALELLLSDHAGDCVAPCEQTCPAHVDIQGYVAYIAKGDYTAAIKLIKERNPFPVVCGRICPHPCESECRRCLVDEPVGIDPLKRFTAEWELENGPYLPPVKSDTGKTVAIIGGGPAGLTAAYYLRQMGHAVTIYEALPELGGMTRYGIPKFRLPWPLLDAEIKTITDLGVKVHLNQQLGKDFTIQDLKNNGANAIVIAIGAHSSKPMQIDHENLPGVMGGIEFLRKVVLAEPVEVGQKVAVIGGGDVAMDCARVAKRCGAEVTLLYRRSQEEMPALQHEQDETREEGVTFRYLTAPLGVIEKNGRAQALKVHQMQLGNPDESGRRRPIAIPGSEEELPFDLIISAIGQDADVSCLDHDPCKPEITKWGTIVYDEKLMTTTVEGVFTAGDCAFGPNTVIQAVAEGKQAAMAIDLYLHQAPFEFYQEYTISKGRIKNLNQADFAPRFAYKKRVSETTFPAEQRLANGGYAPINLGINEAQALAEASRCIECGCNAKFDCSLRKYATEYQVNDQKYHGEKRKAEIDQRHPLIRFEPEKCINCGSCVRICAEVRQISALAFENRGYKTRIVPAFGDALQKTNCDACGMCIDVCPVGAISQNFGKTVGPWKFNRHITTCTSCPRGCALEVRSTIHNQEIIQITSVADDPANHGNICMEGRFAYRLPVATAAPISTELTSIQSSLQKYSQIAFLVSPKLTIETIFAIDQFAKAIKAQVYYLEDSATPQQSIYPYSKINHQANIAFLQHLDITAWNLADSCECLVSVGMSVDSELKAQQIITVPVENPLMMDGTILTNQGQIAFLSNPAAQNAQEVQKIRMKIATMIPEFKCLLEDHRSRLIPSPLPPVLVNVMPDQREVEFENYMKKEALNTSCCK